MGSLHRFTVSCILFFSFLNASADDPYRFTAGAGEAGTGYSCISKEGFWTSFHNQANLGFYKTISFGACYEDRFSIHELSTRTIAIIVPAGNVSIGSTYSHFGYSDLSRNSGTLSCGLKISESIYAGAQIDYFNERTAGEYSNTQQITGETGVIFLLNTNTHLGIHVFNPFRGITGNKSLPTTLNAGLSYQLAQDLFTGIETEITTGRSLVVRTGFEYLAGNKVLLRGGFITGNNSFCFGIGYRQKTIIADIGFITHDRLGITPSASVIVTLR